MGRLEAFALGNKPWPSFVDGIGNGLGYAWILLAISSIREIFASGTWMGLTVMPQSFYAAGYVNNGLLLFPPGAFVILGLIIWAQRCTFWSCGIRRINMELISLAVKSIFIENILLASF